MTIPDAASDLSSAWLASTLDAPIAAVHIENANSGTTGRAVLSVDYAGETHFPPRLFVKLPPADPQQRAFVCATGMGVQEARFYRELAADLPLRVPRCYFSDWDISGEHYVMLLEHLEDSACSFRNASTRYSPEYLRAVLAAFARLHGRYWRSPRFDADLGWVGPIRQHAIARQLLPVTLDTHGASMPPLFTEFCELYLNHADGIHGLWQEGPHTLIHGDVHDGNLFYDNAVDQPGFLDWALLAQGPAMRDVGYFLAGTLAPGEQEEEVSALLAFYREQLQQQGVHAPSMQSLEQQYAIQALYPWLGAVVTLAMGDAWQSSSYVMHTLDRLHCTLEKLRSLVVIRERLGIAT